MIVPLSPSANVPNRNLDRIVLRQKRIKFTKVMELAEAKFDQWKKGIYFTDLQAKFGINKRKAQRILKVALNNHRLFTLSRRNPQEYYPQTRRFEVYEHFSKRHNIPKQTTGTGASNYPLFNCIEFQRSARLLEVLDQIQFYPLYIHRIQLCTWSEEKCYDLINANQWKGNKGRNIMEIVDSSHVTYTYYKNGNTAIDVACSNAPFKLETNDDIANLVSFFGQVRDRFEKNVCDPRGRIVPPITKWILKQADFNKDIPLNSQAQITLPDIQLSTGIETFRLYVKNLNGNAYYRCESSAQINQPLDKFLSSRIDPAMSFLKRLDRIEEELKIISEKLN